MSAISKKRKIIIPAVEYNPENPQYDADSTSPTGQSGVNRSQSGLTKFMSSHSTQIDPPLNIETKNGFLRINSWAWRKTEIIGVEAKRCSPRAGIRHKWKVCLYTRTNHIHERFFRYESSCVKALETIRTELYKK